MDFTLSPELLDSINKHLAGYVGTLNYHNFTKGRKPEDPRYSIYVYVYAYMYVYVCMYVYVFMCVFISCQRHIRSFKVHSTVTVQGVEFVRLRINGNSFMYVYVYVYMYMYVYVCMYVYVSIHLTLNSRRYNQIRKMVGAVVANMRNIWRDTPENKTDGMWVC